MQAGEQDAQQDAEDRTADDGEFLTEEIGGNSEDQCEQNAGKIFVMHK